MIRLLRLATCVLLLLLARGAFAQSPQFSLREFASGQIKKGVRSIGMGGDGATLGNYGLVYREQSTAIVDAGATGFTNGNIFSFIAAGVTTPALWHGLAIYALGLAQTGTGIKLNVHDDWFGPAAQAAHGDGGDELFALRIAMPLGKGFSAGIQLSYEISHFDAVLDSQQGTIRYQSQWRPSGGLGIAWMSKDERLLIGTRVILNHDWDQRRGPFGLREGLYRNYEYRLGIAGSPWKGALLDVGGIVLDRNNALAGGKETLSGGLNLGFEQAFWKRAFVFRFGVDDCQLGWENSDCTYTAGLSFRHGPVNLDLAYLYDLGKARIGTLFGEHSHSVLATLSFNYGYFLAHHPPLPPPARASASAHTPPPARPAPPPAPSTSKLPVGP